MDHRKFIRAMGVVAMNAFDANSDDRSVPGLPLLSTDESVRLGEKLGIERDWFVKSNVCRGLLHSPSAAAGFYGVLDALLFHNKVAARTRELVILRIGWLTRSEYVFCHHVRYSRELKIPDEDILGVRDPQRSQGYNDTDLAVLQLADELHERAEVSRPTWAVLKKAFSTEELVELLLTGGFWRMAAGFVKSAKIPLDDDVPSWPEGRKPDNSVPK